MAIYKITATERIIRKFSLHVEAETPAEADRRADSVDPESWQTEDEYSDAWETDDIEVCEEAPPGVRVLKPRGPVDGA